MGYDYAFLAIYRLALEIRYKAMQDLQGFGTMAIAILTDLQPKTDYHVELQFYCAGAPYLRSNTIPKNFKTLSPSKHILHFLKKC